MQYVDLFLYLFILLYWIQWDCLIKGMINDCSDYLSECNITLDKYLFRSVYFQVYIFFIYVFNRTSYPVTATVSVLNEGPVLFSCSGEVRWSDSFDDTSCIGRRCLANLLQFKNPCSDALLAPEIVFHLPCTADNLHYRLDHFFLATR